MGGHGRTNAPGLFDAPVPALIVDWKIRPGLRGPGRRDRFEHRRGVVVQIKRKPAGMTLFRKDVRAGEKHLAAAWALEPHQAVAAEQAQNHRHPGPREHPSEQTGYLVAISDCVGDRGAGQHSAREREQVEGLALHHRHPGQLRAIRVG
jgi:hypothetical protein